MKATFDCALLYSDTDSLLYEIRGDNFYENVMGDDSLKQHFDFSNYPSSHPFYSSTNKMVTLKFEAQICESVFEEFVGLKAKMYSLIYEDKQGMSAKAVCRFAQFSLTHQVYKNVLNEGSIMRSVNVNRRCETWSQDNPKEENLICVRR